MPFRVRTFEKKDITKVKAFTDRAIGQNYYTEVELEGILKRSQLGDVTFSLVLEELATNKIFGIRITYPAGNWDKGKGKGLTPDKWKLKQTDAAYFQSLFVDPELTGNGWGKKLSEHSIQLLKSVGTKAIVTHSWKESPNDSSGRYLRSLGFELVATHPLYWHEVDYTCTRCGDQKCICTAEEMILYLGEKL